jgi:hypothetical protein
VFQDAGGKILCKILRKILTKDAPQVLFASQRLLVQHLSQNLAYGILGRKIEIVFPKKKKS